MSAPSTLAAQPGRCTLVGAGPGDPELLTLKALKALQAATVVLVDDLVSEAIVALAPPGARIVHVGKRGGCKSTPQALIEQLMLDAVRAGEHVVRLKGGDPAIFGRLDEEIDAVLSVGLNYDIVPGVSSALAAAASAKTALTRRGVARSVRLLTASVGNDQPDNLWHTHLTPSETLVFYMGGLHRQAVAQTLLDKGFDGDTPVVMVFGASWADEAVVRLDLTRMASNDFEQPKTDAPCIILVGKGLRV